MNMRQNSSNHTFEPLGLILSSNPPLSTSVHTVALGLACFILVLVSGLVILVILVVAFFDFLDSTTMGTIKGIEFYDTLLTVRVVFFALNPIFIGFVNLSYKS